MRESPRFWARSPEAIRRWRNATTAAFLEPSRSVVLPSCCQPPRATMSRYCASARSVAASVSGDVSGAVWTIAPAALVPPPWRAIAYGAALALGIGMAAVRIMAGGHFFTDTVFAGVFTFLIIWVVHGLIYRWPRTRLADESVERAIERFALPGHDFLVGLLRKRKTEL